MEIGSIILFIKDMKAAIGFYRDVLGLEPDDPQPFPAHRFYRFDTGQCKLCLHSASKPNEGRTKVVFHVASVAATHAELKIKKVRVGRLDPPNEEGLGCFGFRDPEGNHLQVWGKY
ncbi:MAG: VOC family protein [Gemmataceae bacterium]